VALRLALLSSFACVSNSQPSAPANAIRIGTVLPFSGERAASGVELETALRLAIDVVNSAGGLNGRPLWLEVRDSHSDDVRGTANALEIINDDPISFFIGPEEPTVAYQITNAIKAHRMVHLMPGLTSPDFHDPSAQAAWFRLSPSVHYLACALAKSMRKDGIRVANLVVAPDDYSGTFASVFGQVFTINGGTVFPSLQISSNSAGFADIFTTLSRYALDASVLVTSPAVAAQFLQEWAVRGKPGKWYLGPTLNDPELLRNVPVGVLEGMKGVSADLGARAADFVSYFEAQTAVPPLTGSNYYFDAVALLSLAITHGIAVGGAMPNPAALKTEMMAVTSASAEVVSFDQLAQGLALVKTGQMVQYQGAAGSYVLDSLGDSTQTRGAIWQVQGTTFEDIDYEQCLSTEVETGP
jgi:neutral amino acid transport system substrate-binding protein